MGNVGNPARKVQVMQRGTTSPQAVLRAKSELGLQAMVDFVEALERGAHRDAARVPLEQAAHGYVLAVRAVAAAKGRG